LIHIPLFRNLFLRVLAPLGVHEHIIAKTKYVDDAYQKALNDQFDQILLFGAGYDTRALRFQGKTHRT